MRKKAEILRKLRELEHELTSKAADTDSTYYMNLGRVKALNWVLNKD